jgi:PAS domain S-box-containing protein
MMEDTALLAPSPPGPASSGLDVLSLIADSVICTDEEGRIVAFNRAAEQSFGYSAGEVIGRQVEMLLPQRHREEHVRQVRSFAGRDGDGNRLMGQRREVWGRRKNGEEFPGEAMISRHTSNGQAILTVVHRDITERKELEEQREAFARELDHRIRNVLSVVGALVSLSARSAASIGEFKESLLTRLSALAATQSCLRYGARQSTGLSELLLAELAQYQSPDGGNVIVEGPPVAVAPAPAQTLALAFHELATNSAKYGALSDAGGRVTVTYAVTGEGDQSRLVVQWRDSGGPPVKPPTRRGFGTSLIEEVIRRTFRGDVVLEYPPEGLVCRMTLPKAAVEAGRAG